MVGTPEDREAVAEATEAHVCDMETAVVANVVAERAIPFLAVRAISDDYQHVLPMEALAAAFNASLNTPTPGRLLARLATHPGEIRPMLQFIGNLSLARRNLTNFLRT